MKILIVDDEIHVAHLLAESISSQGHQAIVATSGVDALTFLSKKAPDAVFLDVSMPMLDGVEVLRQIRATHPTLPVIILESRVSEAQIEEVRRLGITDILEKPFVLKFLKDALGSVRDAVRWRTR